ncbi:MAG: hypothetical protein ABIU29_06935 [Chthoniobacterales bacterium]
MKPVHDFGASRSRSRHDQIDRRAGFCAGLSFEFQARRGGNFSYDGSGEPVRRPNFNRLAREVLRADASRTFGLETAVLALVALASLWLIAIMIHEVIRLLCL